MTTQIEVRENTKFEDLNRNNVNRGAVNRRTTVLNYLWKAIMEVAVCDNPKDVELLPDC